MTPYVLVFLGAAWLAGIALARYVPQPLWAWLALAGLWSAGLFVTRDDRRMRLPLLCALFLTLGAARYQIAQPPLGDPRFVAAYNDRGEVTLEGVVVGEPDVRDQQTNLRVRVDALLTQADDQLHTTRGVLLAQVPRFPEYQYGDRLCIFGQLETPPEFEDFSYRDYLARQGVHSLLRFGEATLLGSRQCGFAGSDGFSRPAGRWDLACNPFYQAIFDFKARALETITFIFPEPQASLLSGILLGVESGIPPSLQDAFSATGASHIVAISGFNISVLAGVFIFLGERLAGRRRGAIIAIAGIALYTLLVGAGASVVRAAIMGSLAIVARLLGRQVFGPSALFGAALVMTALNPLTLWDVGFQLSFVATLGLILYAEPFTAAFVRLVARFVALDRAERVAGWASEYFILTLAAQITTLPLIAYYFRRISLISLIANLLILPAQPAVMILGGLAAVAGLLSLQFGTLVAWLAWPFVTFTIAVVELLARVPGASVELTSSFAAAFSVAWYALLIGLTWAGGSSSEKRPAWLSRITLGWGGNVALAAMGLATVVTWSGVFALPDGRLHVTFLDVGQGDGVLIQTPSGEFVLIDGGPGAGTLAEALGRRLPFWKRDIALVVVAAPGDEHIAGLAGALPRYTVQQALVAGAPGKSAAYRELMELFNTRGVPVIAAEAGQGFDLGDGARLEVASASEAGATLRLTHGSASFLFSVGLTGEDMVGFAAGSNAGANASSVLLVPRDEAAVGYAADLAQSVNPWAAVLSVRSDEAQANSIEKSLRGYTVLRTDRRGWISFATDGARLWAETER